MLKLFFAAAISFICLAFAACCDANEPRQVSGTFRELIRQTNFRSENEPQTQLLPPAVGDGEAIKSADEPEHADDPQHAIAERQRMQLELLRKPITSIGIERGDPQQETPENRADALAQSPQQTLLVSSLGVPLTRPNRYPANFHHQPLYFEQSNLERCGRGFGCCQNAVSAVQFLYRVKTWPYHLVSEPMCDCVGTPGDCLSCESFPTKINPFPVDRHGVVLQAAAIAGFVLLLQ